MWARRVPRVARPAWSEGCRYVWGGKRWCSTNDKPVDDAAVAEGDTEPAGDVGAGEEAKGGSMWGNINVMSQDAEEVVVDPDMVPKTFTEYVQYCKTIDAIDIPDLLQKEGLPETTTAVVEALIDIGVRHLLNDEALFYLVQLGWLNDFQELPYRVFQAKEREKVWREMTRLLDSMEDQWGGKTTAALLFVASALGYQDKALSLYHNAIQAGHLNRYSFPSIIYAMGRATDLDRAGEVFRWLEDKGTIRGEEYRSFIFANAKVGNWRDAQYYYEQHKKLETGRTPKSFSDEKLMTTLLAAYARGRNTAGAMKLYEEITAKYTPTDHHTCTAIAACANGSIKSYNEARMLFMRSYDITYTASANAWMKVMVQLALSLQTISRKTRDAIEDHIRGTEIRGNMSSTERSAMMKLGYLQQRFWNLYTIMKDHPSHYEPNAVTFYHALHFAKVNRDPDNAAMVMDDVHAAGLASTTLYNLAIGSWGRCMAVAEAFELFKEMRTKGIAPDKHTYAALAECLAPGQGAKNALQVLENVKKSGLETTPAMLAGCIRAFGTAANAMDLISVCKTCVDMCVIGKADDYVFDSAWLWHTLERPMMDPGVQAQFHAHYPDFPERLFEIAGGPLQLLRAPREVTESLDDFKQQFAVSSGKAVWVLTDEWMLPLEDKLMDYIGDVIAAKEKVVIPYYCLLRLGKIVRCGYGNVKVRDAAFKVLTVLQELFDESAAATERGETPVVDTIYFNEQLYAMPMLDRILDIQDPTAQDLETAEALSQVPRPFNLELDSTVPLKKRPNIKQYARRSIAMAALIKQFQFSQRSQVFFCARDHNLLELGKKFNLEPISVEDVLGADWAKKRRIEDEALMLSWKAPEETLAIGEAAAPDEVIPALTATSYTENEYHESGLHEAMSFEDELLKEELAARKAARAEQREAAGEYERYKSSTPKAEPEPEQPPPQGLKTLHPARARAAGKPAPSAAEAAAAAAAVAAASEPAKGIAASLYGDDDETPAAPGKGIAEGLYGDAGEDADAGKPAEPAPRGQVSLHPARARRAGVAVTPEMEAAAAANVQAAASPPGKGIAESLYGDEEDDVETYKPESAADAGADAEKPSPAAKPKTWSGWGAPKAAEEKQEAPTEDAKPAADDAVDGADGVADFSTGADSASEPAKEGEGEPVKPKAWGGWGAPKAAAEEEEKGEETPAADDAADVADFKPPPKVTEAAEEDADVEGFKPPPKVGDAADEEAAMEDFKPAGDDEPAPAADKQGSAKPKAWGGWGAPKAAAGEHSDAQDADGEAEDTKAPPKVADAADEDSKPKEESVQVESDPAPTSESATEPVEPKAAAAEEQKDEEMPAADDAADVEDFKPPPKMAAPAEEDAAVEDFKPAGEDTKDPPAGDAKPKAWGGWGAPKAAEEKKDDTVAEDENEVEDFKPPPKVADPAEEDAAVEDFKPAGEDAPAADTKEAKPKAWGGWGAPKAAEEKKDDTATEDGNEVEDFKPPPNVADPAEEDTAVEDFSAKASEADADSPASKSDAPAAKPKWSGWGAPKGTEDKDGDAKEK